MILIKIGKNPFLQLTLFLELFIAIFYQHFEIIISHFRFKLFILSKLLRNGR